MRLEPGIKVHIANCRSDVIEDMPICQVSRGSSGQFKLRQEWAETLAHTLHPLGFWPGENTKTDVTQKVQENLEELAELPNYQGIPVRTLIK